MGFDLSSVVVRIDLIFGGDNFFVTSMMSITMEMKWQNKNDKNLI